MTIGRAAADQAGARPYRTVARERAPDMRRMCSTAQGARPTGAGGAARSFIEGNFRIWLKSNRFPRR